MVDLERLFEPLEDAAWEGGLVRVEPMGPEHKEGIRACCDPGDPVWDIYPYNLARDFELIFPAALATPSRKAFVVLQDGTVRGTTSFMNIAPDKQGLEIGGTYMAPDARGTGLNGRVKRLLLDRAFACGIRRVEFRIDERNGRSQAAVLKLGATKEGILRAERITWTGFVRDTGIFSILACEWQGRSQQ